MASGLKQVPADALEAAIGMGLTPRQVFWKVELPLALPVLLSGLRVTTVQVVGLAVVAALIGAGGFGALVFQGLLQQRARPRPARRLAGRGAGHRGGRGLPADGPGTARAGRMIELQQVAKSFGAVRAVDDVSLTIERGEFVVLIGASGSGKSTLLKMINRLVEHDRGRILFMGDEIRIFPARGSAPAHGLCHPVDRPVPALDGGAERRHRAATAGLARRAHPRARGRVAGLAGPGPPQAYRQRYPHQLSGGQQQRVGVARALAADPEVLLMDEPFGALDPITRQSLQQELARIHRLSGKTIVLVTHDIDEALRLATRIVLLDHGRVVQAGTPAQLLGRPANAAVSDFMGRSDLGLKLLGLQTVAERLRAGELAEGEPVDADLSLREVCSVFVARHVDRLPVVDAQGRPAGTIHFVDLLKPPP